MNHHQPTNRLYENCSVLNVNGLLIFRCAFKRANWYVKKGLADIISESPFTVKLNFTTNGDGKKGDQFYLQDKVNECVVCGCKDNLTHHHIVPCMFRRHFPGDIKEHNHHDILLLCFDCHEKYENFADVFKKELAKEYNVPVDGYISEEDKLVWKNESYVGQWSNTLIKHSTKIPQQRKDFIIAKIEEVIGRKIKDGDLESFANKKAEYKITTCGKIIVSKLTNIPAFEKIWREHFIKYMQPKFLPELWSVDGRK